VGLGGPLDKGLTVGYITGEAKKMNFQALTEAWRTWAVAEPARRPEPTYPATVHIRKAATRAGRAGYGKRYYTAVAGYVDPRGTTLCGAEPTLYDRGWRERRAAQTAFETEHGMILCARCAELGK